MKKRLCAFLLSVVILAGILPVQTRAADEPQFDDFFTTVSSVVSAENTSNYPFTVDTETEGGPWLKSGTIDTTFTRSTLTLKINQAAILTFDYKISSPSSSGLEVKNGNTTLYNYSNYGSGVTGCNGEKTGTAVVQADAGDTITISYYRDYVYSDDTSSDCIWLKNFQATLPAQVIFHANNNTNETQNQGIFDSGTLMYNPFAYEGHIFKGWATSEGSSDIDYADGASITISQDTHLYAVWAPVYELSFTLTQADAEFTLFSDAGRETELTPDSADGYTYTLENGTYYWTASAFGYESADGTVTLAGSGQTVAVTLEKQPAYTVTFTYGDLIDGADIENGTLEVKTGDRVLAPAEDGGLVFELPVGHDYAWTFKSGNYARQAGDIDLSQAAESGTQNVTIPLEEKTAWEGADDILEPAKQDGVYQISSGAELAWLAQEVNAGRGASYDAALTRDIDLGGKNWTPIGNTSSRAYKGVFDGQGYIINGLNIDSSSTYQALFGYTNGATVRNLTVKGSVKAGQYAAGLLAQAGYGTTLENCISRVNVVSSGGFTGGLVGDIYGGNTSVRSCANLGDISGRGYNVGGLVGRVYNKSTIENCYNCGGVTNTSGYTGGLVGALNDSNALVRNCYTAGTVSGASDANPAVGKKNSGTVENVYYLSTTGADANATAKTEAEMKSAGFVAELGAAFQKDMADQPINSGYPILTFQDTTPKYEVTIATTPAEAAVTLINAAEEVILPISSAGGTTTYRLPDGTYTYSVSAFGYITERGSVTVDGGTAAQAVTLTLAGKRTVSFRVTPAEAAELAQITVTYDGDGRAVAAEADGTYLLPTGGYHYTVRAKGYAKAEGALSVNGNESGAQHVDITLQASSQWDGESQEAVTPNGEGVYEISSGAELAWFAAQVNSGAGANYNALLTDDIDLGDYPWTPIGNTSSAYYSGTFDGGGYTVSGLNVAGAELAGLFGYVKGTSSQNAELKNMVVQGSVEGNYAGGIAGRTDYVVIQNCGNEAAVTGSEYAGGIVGQKFSYSGTLTIGGCYNTAAVSGDDRAGGILGYVSGAADVRHCYNTGNIAAGTSGYAGGIRASSSSLGGATESCYHTGTTSGKSTGPILANNIGDVTDCFYLGSEIAGAAGTAKTSDELKNLVDTLNAGADPALWKSVSSLNAGYPVRAWQKAGDGSGETGGKLNKATGLAWQKDAYGLDTGVASWSAVPNADSYTVILWDYWSHETEYGAENGLSPIKTVTGVQGTSYDFTQDIVDNGPSWYYFTVTPIAAEGSGYESGDLPVWDDETQTGDVYDYINMMNDVCYRYTAQLDMPAGLMWMGPAARWEFVDDAMGYLVSLYRVDDNNVAQYTAGGLVGGQTNTLDCTNYFAVGGRYVFTVTALSEEYLLTGIADKNSPESRLSSDATNGGTERGIYIAEAIPEPDPGETDRTGWVAISSAEQWMELANMEDLPSAGDPQTSQQAVEWAKKYYLTADLDFSNLSAADQVRTKSIGNATNRFTGIMDGNGHKITGLTLSNYDSGLFAYIGSSGQVYDMTIDGANVQFSDNAAVLALNNYGTIRDCLIVNCNITADTGAVLGGMVSRNYGVVRDSAVQGGTLKSNSVTATGHAGFVGANEGGLIERCWTSMNVDTQSDYAGGFVGLGYGGTIRNCFALGNVSARGYSGGFAGRSVYEGNTYQNCYAAGVVSVTDSGTGHGFIGGNKPDSAFQCDQSEGIENCYYNASSPADENGAQAKTLAEMQSSDFLIKLAGSSGAWLQAADKNGGLPYLADVFVPEDLPTSAMTVQIALAAYDKDSYAFRQMGEIISVTLQSSGNTRVVDVMDAAAGQGLLTYSYDTTPTFGRYIHTINGYAVEDPDGWMFTINDSLSSVSASLATVQDGDKLLWYEGTTENRFLPPAWDDLSGADIQWVDIGSPEALLALANSSDAGTLSENYRLTADLDLTDVSFPGIGTAALPFTGVFDGQGHTISNAAISGTANTGFFGVIKGATIKNLTLEHATVTGTDKVGVLAGWAQTELDKDDMGDGKANLIGNCHVSGAVAGTEAVGGLVGLNGGESDPDTLFSISSAIDKCTADVDVTVTGRGSKVGGLVGNNSGVITKSASLGDVHAENASMVGGLAGESYDGSIYDSHAEGNVTGSSHTGGFAGSSSGVVRNCYSLGDVSGKDYTGGFAGSLTHADNVIGAGKVTVIEGGSHGYNGGLAGQLNGTLTGVDSQITIKEAYGNCMTAGGGSISIIGNSHNYQSESQKAVLESLTLSSQAEVSQKLYEMFGVNPLVSDALRAEAAKYAEIILADAAAGETVSLLKAGEAADHTAFTVEYKVDSDYLTGGPEVTLVKVNDTSATLTTHVTVSLTETATGDVYLLTVSVILPVGQDAMQELMDAIAAGYTDSSDGWTVMDMAVYSSLPGKTAATSEQALQNALNLLITEAAGDSATASDRARIEIVLRAMGIDSSKLYPANSNTPFSNAQKLAGMDLTSGGYYAAPYLLLANLQGNLQLTDGQITHLISLLKAGMGDGLFGYEWDGVTYSDPDTAGVALAALARFYSSNEEAKTVVDTILSALPGAMNAAGSLGSANSDAMVILGLLAVGQDPYELKAASGASVVDGLLSYVNRATNSFQFGGMDNALATEQGFRALVALTAWQQGTSYNLYDFSSNSIVPGRATGSGEVTPPEDPDTDKTINVTFTLKTDAEIWIPATPVTVKEGATVYHVFTAALQDRGDMSAVGAATGYVKSVTKGDVTLAEFDKGPNSGWLFKVNGELPAVGLTSCPVKEGDNVLFYYTTDWTQDPQAGSVIGGTPKTADQKAADAVSALIAAIGTVTADSGDAIQAARDAYDALTAAQKALVDNYDVLTAAERQYAALTGQLPFKDVQGHWAADAIQYVYAKGLMNGVGDDTFAPGQSLDRAMLVTILYRLEGSDPVTESSGFSDVGSDTWYTDAVLWAKENEIVNGYDNGTFGPEDPITREQIAAILYRYAVFKAYPTASESDLGGYTDAGEISGYAIPAMKWANAQGLITGTSATTLLPTGTASRAEAAVILMRFCEIFVK